MELLVRDLLSADDARAALSRPQKHLTLVYVIDLVSHSVLLGYKARGFGVGKWNGFGGKVEKEDESTECAARRELTEECGLVSRVPLTQCGILFFHFEEEHVIPILMVHVFLVDYADCSGTVVPSEEMHPVQWFPFEQCPIRDMWADDVFWLPQLLDFCSHRSCTHEQVDTVRADNNLRGFEFAAYFKFCSFEVIERKCVKFLQKDELQAFLR